MCVWMHMYKHGFSSQKTILAVVFETASTSIFWDIGTWSSLAGQQTLNYCLSPFPRAGHPNLDLHARQVSLLTGIVSHVLHMAHKAQPTSFFPQNPEKEGHSHCQQLCLFSSWNCTGLCQDYVVQLGFVSLRFQKSWPRHLIFLSVRPLPSHSGDMDCWGGICQQLGKSAFPIGLSDFSKNGWVSLASSEEGNDTYTAALGISENLFHSLKKPSLLILLWLQIFF